MYFVFYILSYSFKNAQYDNIEGGDHDENEFEVNQDP